MIISGGYSVANVSSLNKLVGNKEAIESCALSCVLLISTYFPVYFKCQYMKVRDIFLLVNIVIMAMPITLVLILAVSLNLSIKFYESKDL